ncbi:MAG: hypothetical protein WB816_04025 [Methylocystis sp.]
MKISAAGFARYILGAAKESVKILSHLKLKIVQDISYSVSNFIERFTYASGFVVPDLFAKRKFFASSVFELFKGRGRLKYSVVVRAAIALAAIYTFATQFTGAPNYYANYDLVLPPKGPDGPVAIRKDRDDKVGEGGYGSKIIAVAAAAIEDELSRGWCPSETFLTPSSLRIDTCAFQLGKHQMLADSIEAYKQEKIGFQGTPNDYDPDLMKATGNVNFDPNVWIWFYGTTNYLSMAVQNLRDYNNSLVSGASGMNADLNKVARLIELFYEETEGESSVLSRVESNDFALIGASRAAFTHAKGVFSMTCELLKALEVDAFKALNDINVWEAFDAAKADTCRVERVTTPVVSFVGDIGLQLAELKGAAQISHARLSALSRALTNSGHY